MRKGCVHVIVNQELPFLHLARSTPADDSLKLLPIVGLEEEDAGFPKFDHHCFDSIRFIPSLLRKYYVVAATVKLASTTLTQASTK